MTTTLFHGGRIHRGGWPGDDGTADTTWVLVEDERIAAIGRSEDLPGSDRRVDLAGGTLVPAFRDAHVHLPATGLYAQGMDFRGEHSAAAILDAFRRRAADGDALLFGGNFEDPLDAPLLGRDLDGVVGARPALLARADMHSCIVSGALLEQLELDGLEGVDRDVDGLPTGYLREQAASEAWSWFDGNLSPDQQIAAVRAAIDLAYSKGLAEVHEMFVVEWRGWDSAEVFRRAIADVALDIAVFFGTDEVERVRALIPTRIGGDYFLDGSFGSHTAWMKEPFASTPPDGSSPTGISYREDEPLYRLFSRAQAEGMQMGVHAIGDAAIEQAILTWERVAADVGSDAVSALGHRIEHFECASDDHIERAVRLGLRASVQPAFDLFWGGPDGLYAERIGWERASRMNRFKTMIDRGLMLAAGSDSTVTPMDPFLQMKALRAHHVESERLPANVALALHTIGPAAVNGHADRKGAIREGLEADLAWLDRDPLGVDEEELGKTEVLGNWIGGQRVWPKTEAEAD